MHDSLGLDLSNVDLLVHTGDFTVSRDPSMNYNEAIRFFEWFERLEVKHKVLIPGNHDTSVGAGMHRNTLDDYRFHFLNHQSVEIEGIKIFGSPYTPSFGHGWAYNVPRHKLHDYWEEIPEDTDLLLTHGPAQLMLDSANRGTTTEFEAVGDKALFNRIKLIQPKFHISGHIHEDGGKVLKQHNIKTTFINAAVVDLWHKIKNPFGIKFEL